METLSKLITHTRKLIPENPNRWNIPKQFNHHKGDCVLCGTNWASGGHPPKFGNNFTSYELLQHGDIICPYCKTMQSSQEYRRTMWLVTPEEWIPFKKKEGKKILISKKTTPFALYFTKTWKKQGWVSLMNYINESNDHFYVGFDYDVILVDREKLEEDFILIDYLRKLKISKEEIKTGHFKSKSVNKINDVNIIKKVLNKANSSLWELEVYLNE